MATLLLFRRVWLRRTFFLSAPKTFVNVSCRLEWISVRILCSLITHLISGLVLVRPLLNRFFCYFQFAELPVSEYTPLTSPPFRVDLPRTVSGYVCLTVEKMAPFVNIFDLCLRDRHRGKKIEPLLLRICGIAHCTWLSFDRKYEGKWRPTN